MCTLLKQLVFQYFFTVEYTALLKDGFMGITESTIQEIVRRVLAVCRPNKIILFGSAATASMTKDSDIDLLLLENNVIDTRRESVRIRRVLRGLGFPFDIIVMDTAVFDATRNIVGTIAYPAEKYGKVLYAES
jgi:predicted nucleotidyltransferase